ncbi:hypothetical protein Dimus_038706 [Dionaea muscipula]
MDFKTAFLNGVLEEQVFVEQPLGYEAPGQEHQVLKLKRALYGLKQAPRTWNTTLDTYLQQQGFTRCPHEYAFYVKKMEYKLLLICVYVDDLLITGSSLQQIEQFKHSLVGKFEMTDLGLMNHYLGLEVEQKKTGIFMSQRRYIEQVLKEVNLTYCKLVNTPIALGTVFSGSLPGAQLTDATVYRSVVGSLRYIACTRPNIVYAVGMVSRYMQRPTTEHWMACKRILRYLKGTLDHGLWYPTVTVATSVIVASAPNQAGSCVLYDPEQFTIMGYSDSDWAGDIDERKSTTGWVFMAGTTTVSWASKKQLIVALSSSKPEYVAAAACVSHAVWLRKLLAELQLKQERPMMIHVDNQSAIAIAKNPVYHDRSKHIDVRFYFLREAIAQKEVELSFVRTHAQVADVFTKALSFAMFSRCRRMLGVQPNQA